MSADPPEDGWSASEEDGRRAGQASRESYLSRVLDLLWVEEKEREKECTRACDGGRRV